MRTDLYSTNYEAMMSLIRNTAYRAGLVSGMYPVNAANEVTAVFVCLLNGRHVEINESDFSGSFRDKDPEGLEDNGMVLNLFGVFIPEDQLGRFRLKPRMMLCHGTRFLSQLGAPLAQAFYVVTEAIRFRLLELSDLVLFRTRRVGDGVIVVRI